MKHGGLVIIGLAAMQGYVALVSKAKALENHREIHNSSKHPTPWNN